MFRQITLTIFAIIACVFYGQTQTKCDSTAFFEAIDFSQTGELEKAIDKYSVQIKLCPNFTEAYINRGVCYFRTKQKQQFIKDFQTAIQVSNEKANTLNQVAGFYFAIKRYDTAFSIFKSVVNIDKNNSQAYFKMGRCKWLERIKILQENKVEDYAKDTAFKSHLKDEIMSYYDKAIYIDSSENENLYKSRDQIEAMQDMNTNYEYYYYRGLFKSNFYEYVGSLKDYEKSIQIHPTISAYEYAAYLAKKVGQMQKACNYIQTWATMINPSEETDTFKKHEIADKFCKEIGIKAK